MRYVLAATSALVVGLALGGLGPRAELRRVEARSAELEERACGPLLASELVRAIQGAPPPAVGSDASAPSVSSAPVEVSEEEAAAPSPPEPEDPEDFEEGRTLLAARRAQARAALIEGADPSPEQLEAFDVAVADMNADLRAIGEELLVRVRELGEAPPRGELYLVAAEGLEVILATEGQIREALGPAVAEVDEEVLDPLSHLDPAHVDLLMALEAAGFDE